VSVGNGGGSLEPLYLAHPTCIQLYAFTLTGCAPGRPQEASRAKQAFKRQQMEIDVAKRKLEKAAEKEKLARVRAAIAKDKEARAAEALAAKGLSPAAVAPVAAPLGVAESAAPVASAPKAPPTECRIQVSPGPRKGGGRSHTSACSKSSIDIISHRPLYFR